MLVISIDKMWMEHLNRRSVSATGCSVRTGALSARKLRGGRAQKRRKKRTASGIAAARVEECHGAVPAGQRPRDRRDHPTNAREAREMILGGRKINEDRTIESRESHPNERDVTTAAGKTR
jgi:hypothetical protein